MRKFTVSCFHWNEFWLLKDGRETLIPLQENPIIIVLGAFIYAQIVSINITITFRHGGKKLKRSDCNGEYELENAKVSDDSPPHNSEVKTQ